MSTFLLYLLVNGVIGWKFENSFYFLLNGSEANGTTQFAVSIFACAVLCDHSECAAFKFTDNRCFLVDDYGESSNASTGMFYTVKPAEPESFVLREYCPFDNTTMLNFSTTNCPTLVCQPKMDKLKPKDKEELCDCLNDCLDSNCKFFTRESSKPCSLDPNSPLTTKKTGRQSPDVQNCTCAT